MTSPSYPATTAHEHLCLLHLLPPHPQECGLFRHHQNDDIYDVIIIIITFSVCLEEASAVMERAHDRGDHKRVNFPSSSIPKILYFLAGFGLSQFIGVFIYYVIFR